MGEGAGELLGRSGGSGCGQLSMQLLLTDISPLSLNFGGFFGWGKGGSLDGERCWGTVGWATVGKEWQE